MIRYDLVWSDGRAAASRGGQNDNIVHTHINAENEQEMWKLAYLLRRLSLIKSASMKNLPSIKDEMEDAGYEDYEIEEMLNRDDYDEKALDSINLDDIDGGDPWIISISVNGNEIYNCGYGGSIIDDDEDW